MNAQGFVLKALRSTAFAVVALCSLATSSATNAASRPGQSISNEFNSRAFRSVPGLPEALIASGPTTRAENLDLDKAVAAFKRQQGENADYVETVRPVTEFLSRHADSPWATSLHLNLGLGYYRNGYFSKAIEAYRAAWEAGKRSTSPSAMAQADKSIGELGVMYSRVGESAEVVRVLDSIADRQIRGPATELIASVRESLWTFNNEPGIGFLCGPMALKSLLTALKFPAAAIAELDKIKSPSTGFAMSQVSDMASRAGLEHRLIRRKEGESVPVPSIVNWKVSHYAAIVEERDGRYRVQDPTFGHGEFWMTKAAIDSEASGYFLVPTGSHRSVEWQVATVDEAMTVFGKGSTGQNDEGGNTPADEAICPDPKDDTDPSNSGMCVANVKLMLTSLHLTDTPVGYRPPKGPAVYVRLTYNQREGDFPAAFTYFNVGPKWSINFSSFIQDNAADQNVGVRKYALGGGYIDYPSPLQVGNLSGVLGWVEPLTGSALRRMPSSGPLARWEVIHKDGAIDYYEKLDGATTGLRRTFLTRIQDKTGNALTLHYDDDLLLTSITDASGRSTKLTYVPNTRRIETITDPFGRRAVLAYNRLGYLSSITDVLGLTSSFQYNLYMKTAAPGPDPWNDGSGYGIFATPSFANGRQAASNGGGCNQCTPAVSAAGPGMPGGLITRTEYLIYSMATPYGLTRFDFGFDSRVNSRYLNIKDPLGYTQRVEFRHQAPGIAASDPDANAYPGGLGGGNEFLDMRNTFIWDKHAYAVAAGDYTKARLIHWLHYDANTTSGWKESEKKPLEGRVWYGYQNDSYRIPRLTYRALENGISMIESKNLGFNGHVEQSYDASGRRTGFQYANFPADDLTGVDNGYGALASFTYNAQHKPITYTDAAKQVTSYTYNDSAQVTSATNALGQTTRYEYDPIGRLITVTNANGNVQLSLTYDFFDRVATRTDSEGYVLSYTYDAMDRVTQISYPDGTRTTLQYVNLDLAYYTDRLGRTTQYVHDANRRLTSVIDPLNRSTQYDYYENGVLKSITDPKGNVTSWEIDLQSRPIAKHYADSTTETYSYGAKSGRLLAVTDARGITKSYTYAADGLVTAISYSDGATHGVSYGYDPVMPRMTSMTDGIGDTKFSYGTAGAPGAHKIISDDGPYDNDVVGYAYDKLGRVIGKTVGGASETFEYDAIGRVSRDTNAIGDFSLTYLGQTSQITTSRSPTVGSLWTYDDNIGDRRLKSSGSYAQGRGFNYITTPENRVMAMRDEILGTPTSQTWDYSYDAADRLTDATARVGASNHYAYDAADNITSINGVAATYNSVNEIKTLGGSPYQYDSAGNAVDDGLRSYQWDAESRLVGISYKNAPGQTSRFAYDGLGRRLAITESTASGSSETRYAWCGGPIPCQARSAADAVVGSVYQEGVALNQGTKTFFSRDQIGSVRDVLDAGSGTSIVSYDFDSYGVQRTSASPVDFGFAGMFVHKVSGLNLTIFRAYDPRAGGWLSRDPLGGVAGFNAYSYSAVNPISNVDREGLFAWTIPFLLKASAGFAVELGAGATATAAGGVAAAGVVGYGVGTLFDKFVIKPVFWDPSKPKPPSVPVDTPERFTECSLLMRRLEIEGKSREEAAVCFDSCVAGSPLPDNCTPSDSDYLIRRGLTCE